MMSWYKKAIKGQEDFPFLKDIPKQEPIPIEQTEQYQKLLKRTPDLLQNLLDNCENLEKAIQVLKLYKFKFKIIEDIVLVTINNKSYIIDDMLELKDPLDWIWIVPDCHLDDYN